MRRTIEDIEMMELSLWWSKSTTSALENREKMTTEVVIALESVGNMKKNTTAEQTAVAMDDDGK